MIVSLSIMDCFKLEYSAFCKRNTVLMSYTQKNIYLPIMKSSHKETGEKLFNKSVSHACCIDYYVAYC